VSLTTPPAALYPDPDFEWRFTCPPVASAARAPHVGARVSSRRQAGEALAIS